MSSFPVAVTGMGVVTALGAGVDPTFDAVLQGRRGTRRIQRFDSTGCRVRIAAEVSAEVVDRVVGGPAGGTTRTAKLAVRAAREALIQAGYPRAAPPRTALVLGTAGAGDAALERHLERLRAGTGRDAVLGRYPKRATTDSVATELGVDGPLATLNTACSSSAVAIIHAIELLRAGFCAQALAGGSDELTRYTFSGFGALRALDPEPCRPFDRTRRGMSLGEGAGFLVLEPLPQAQQRGAAVLGLVAGYGHSCDAGHLTAPDPSGAGAARAIRAALAMAGITPADVGFVNAHGTGTLHNDRAELAALALALGERLTTCPVHSVKACIGHCMGAAGAIEAVITMRSLQRRVVPHTPGLVEPEEPMRADFVMHDSRSTAARYALSNSFGFGGNDAALVIATPEVAG